ncbi:MAG TPA: LptA/OstA family protein [Thermotogota bacterium]|nr:LptA/OstA family protein [Thermotogota bacterium]HPR94856.1 LptA/OstA family protein [Thermotogota bacterium]
MRNISQRLTFILLVILILFSTSLFSENTLEPESGEVKIEISADRFNFSGDNSRVIFSGNVRIKYEEMIIEAPTITAYFSSPDTIDFFKAESSESTSVILHKDKEVFTSKSLKAYVQKRAYFLYELRGTYKSKNAKGKEQDMILASEKSRSKTFEGKNITEAHRGYLTTCDEEKPHYRFQANYIVVKNSNEIIAYDLLMYIYDIPILPYPVFFTSLERTAQPVESSFTFTGSSGIQTHLRFNYFSKGDEIGSVFFDTVGDGDKKGNTIGTENKFTLPDGKTKIYFYGLQKTGEDFSNRNSEIKLDLSRKWNNSFDSLFYYRNKQTVSSDIISTRNSEIGITLKGNINGNGSFAFEMGKQELRSSSKNTDTYILPSFSMGTMRYKFFEDIYPVSINFNTLKFSAKDTTDASATFAEVLESLQYAAQYGVSTSLPKVVIRDITLVNGFTSSLQYSFKDDAEYKDDLFFDNTFELPKIGFDWEDYFGLHTQYTMRAGYLDDAEGNTAYRYSENVKTDLNFKLFIWDNTISHDYVFLKSDGNTSRFGYNKEKSLLSLTSALKLEPLGSSISLKTTYDFLKNSEQLSNPQLITNTAFDLFETDISLNTKSTIDASSTKFLSTDYSFKVDNQYFYNNLSFIYLYDQEINIKKLADSFGIKFGPFEQMKKISSDFDLVFLDNNDEEGLKLDKITNRNSISIGQFGVINSLTENFDIQIYPQEDEEKINYIKNTLNMKLEDMTLAFSTKYSKNKKIAFDFGGTFEKLTLNFGTTYDIDDTKIESIKLSMVKDLHCWENETSVEFGLNSESELELTKFTTSFAIKAFPEKHVKIEPLKKEFDLAIF